MFVQNRVGKFEIDHKTFVNDLNAIKEVMKKVVIVRAECMFYSNSIEYIGYCEDFDHCPHGNSPDTYSIIVKTELLEDNTLEYKITFEKQKGGN